MCNSVITINDNLWRILKELTIVGQSRRFRMEEKIPYLAIIVSNSFDQYWKLNAFYCTNLKLSHKWLFFGITFYKILLSAFCHYKKSLIPETYLSINLLLEKTNRQTIQTSTVRIFFAYHFLFFHTSHWYHMNILIYMESHKS